MGTTVEEICDRLVAVELMDRDGAAQKIDAWRAQVGDGSGGDDFVRWLVAGSYLTEFQGEALLAGLPAPPTLGPYRVYERVALGRLGTIYRAVHTEFNQRVCIKIFSSSLGEHPEKLARLGREARVSIEVDHPNVVRTFQVGQVGANFFLAIEDLVGESLASRLMREKRIPFGQACHIVSQAAIGLDHLHTLGIVHRDIQPANLWLVPNGVVKIMEFGAARDALAFLDTTQDSEHPTIMDVIVGTYDYMAPEQAQEAHTADARSDVYSLGCTLYHCLTGQPPFPDKNPVRQMLRHANERPRPLSDFVPDTPLELADTVSSMLAKKREDRYQYARDVARVIEQFADPGTIEPELESSLNPEFLGWIRSAEGHAATGSSTSPTSPQGAEFLRWLESQFGQGF